MKEETFFRSFESYSSNEMLLLLFLIFSLGFACGNIFQIMVRRGEEK